jgi:hypothetical protein
MMALSLAFTLVAALATPAPRYPSPPPGCPYPAIGVINIHGSNFDYSTGGDNVETQEHDRVLTVRFWLEHSPAQALIVLDLSTEHAYATFGSVRRYGNRYCAFPDR